MSELLSRKDVARLLQVAPETVARWVREGKFPQPLPARCRKKLWPREAVESFLQTTK